jgi:fused signal recognition particle receptor
MYTQEALKNAISNILLVEGPDVEVLAQEARKSGEPLKIMFVGINGTGKTTTISKLSDYFISRGFTPVIAASDTFRAGAIEQITYHAEKLKVKIIKHQKGADPAAVAYDAVEHARAQKKELVFIDTAGRMQTNINLMDEMKKIQRVVKPDLVIFVGDALTGNDVVEQASKFNDAVGLDGIILTKADADAKGGAALSIGYVVQKPILFLGIGQDYKDIIEFKPDWMVEQIFGE